MAGRGVEVHAVSPYVSQKRQADGVWLHPVPRMRHLAHSIGAVCSMLNRGGDRFANGAAWRQRFEMSRYNRVIQSVLLSENIDVIYSPFAWPFNTAGLHPAKACGVPVVVSLRGVDVLVEESIGYGRMLNATQRSQMSITLRGVDHVIGVSQALIDRGIALGADPDHVSVVLKGVNLSQFGPDESLIARKRLALPERLTILFVGNLIPRKGFALLLQAFAAVRRSVCNVQLVICGDGPEMKALQTQIRELEIESSVIVAGRIGRDLIADYFRACDVFVLPSLTEGSGNVLVEAGACAKPLVGTDVAGIPDYIEDGVTGFLFQKGNAADLSQKLLAILSNPRMARRMGVAAQRGVEEKHTYDGMLDHLLDLFKQVVNEKQM